MKNIRSDVEYINLVKDILENKKFNQLASIVHHNHNRLDHCLKISYYSYKISKFLRLDYKETARGGLLHDFYLERVIEHKKISKKIVLFTTKHPNDAVKNSRKIFYLTNKEIDIIKTHMFPFDFKIPRYLESWVVNLVDTNVSIWEFYIKLFNYLKSKIIKMFEQKSY